MAVRITRNPQLLSQLREDAAFGLLNFVLAVENRTKAVSVVRGGNRSFAPGGPIGGTLRRSWHAVVTLDGAPIAGSATSDDNGNAVPGYAPSHDIAGFVGSNTGYGAFVELGTVKMAARPMLGQAALELRGSAEGLIAAGAARHGSSR